jgi:predicted SAM-dependent methyltransferase
MDQAARDRIKGEAAGCSRLHVGCGFLFAPDWINVGLFEESYLPYGTTKYNNGLVLHLDITKDFPFDDGSLTAIYAAHFVEHFSFDEGLELARTFHRALAPGGVLRLTFPDLALWARKYVERDAAFFDRYRKFFLSDPAVKVRTPGEIFMSQVHGWGHRWGYDVESVTHLLQLAGFEQASSRQAFESAIPDVRRLESSWEGRLMETGYVEAIR